MTPFVARFRNSRPHFATASRVENPGPAFAQPPSVDSVDVVESANALPPEVAPGEGRSASEPTAAVTAAEAVALHLTPARQAAIVQLTSGATRRAAALAAGVTRATLYNWLNHDPHFQAAFNAWHKDLITTAQGQLLAASQEAVNTVLTAILRGDARLAWKLLESQGVTKLCQNRDRPMSRICSGKQNWTASAATSPSGRRSTRCCTMTCRRSIRFHRRYKSAALSKSPSQPPGFQPADCSLFDRRWHAEPSAC